MIPWTFQKSNSFLKYSDFSKIEVQGYEVKPVVVATSIEQAYIQFKQKTTLKSSCIKQVHVISMQSHDYHLGACLIQV